MAAPGYTHNTSAEPNLSTGDDARSSAMEMQKYFGPLRNSDIDTFASDAFAHETHNLPRAYVGRNKFLMATIDFLITKDDDWYTRYILPWLFTEELHVKWNIWRFNRTMMDYEPEQGVPRYVSYESESRSDSLVRRGLAFIIEHGFYKTELGRQHYLMNLKQIVEAVHETVYFGVMHELLQAPNFYEQWLRKHGPQHGSMRHNDAVTTLSEERWRFACVQKDVKGLFILDAEIKDRMRRVGIEPTAWIFPSKMAIYASMVPEYFNEYSRGGNPAVTALEDGAKRFDTFRGCNVFETRPFDTDFMSAGAVEPLMRNREIGEFYVMDDTCTEHGIQIFDMSRDRFRTITFAEAHISAVKQGETSDNSVVRLLLQHYGQDKLMWVSVRKAILKCIANLTGKMKNDVKVINNRKKSITELKEELEKAVEFDAFNTASNKTSNNPAIKDLALLFKGTNTVDLKNDENLASIDKYYLQYDILMVPHKMLLFRPRMTYRMGSAILLKGGEELGNTLHGHHDFQLTDDVIHKTHIGHYTFYSKSVVREPKNMYLAEDVYCAGYCGGENTKFIQAEIPSEIKEGLTEEMNHGTASILAIAVPHDFEPDACMSVLGDLSKHGPGLANSMTFDDAPTLQILGEVLKDHVRQYTASHTATADPDDMMINGICFRGAEKVSKDGIVWTQRQQNTGHWGPSVYDGCASVRMGNYAHLKPCISNNC